MYRDPQRPRSRLVNRQAPSECILTCITNSLSGTSCTSVTDLTCICSSAAFQAAASTCITANCPDQQAAALALLQSQCSSVGVSSTPSADTSTPAQTSQNGSPETSTDPSTTSDGNGSTPTNPPTPGKSSSKVGPIVGGVAGGVALIIIALLVVFLLRRRSKRQQVNANVPPGNNYQTGYGSQPHMTMGGAPWSQGVAVTQYPEITSAPSGPNQYSQPSFPPPITVSSSVSMTRPISPSTIGGAPPEYHAGSTNATSTGSPMPVYPDVLRDVGVFGGASSINSASSPSEAVYNDVIGQYAAANRDVINSDLERKLRAARYLPTDNPSDMPAEEWGTRYGVGTFELRRLQELYDRNEIGVKASKEVHSSGQGGPTWRPTQ